MVKTRISTGILPRKILHETEPEAESDGDDATSPYTPPVSLESRGQDSDVGDPVPRQAKGKKRAKKTESKGRKLKSKLSLLMSMPADIFCEVIKHLLPLDILHLSRTSKPLRSLLMRRSSKFAWVAARKNVDLPDCPSDLSEQQYASLIFEKQCQICGYQRACKTDFDLRIRLCVSCLKLNVLRGTAIMKCLPSGPKTSNIILRLVPFHVNYYRPKQTCYRVARRVSFLDLDEHELRGMRFFKPDMMKAAREYYALNTKPAAQQEYVDRRVKINAEITAHAVELEDWHSRYVMAERDELTAVFTRRRASIEGNLRELGYSSMEITAHGLHWDEWNSMIFQPRELTPRIWKTIQPKLEFIIADRHKKANLRARKSEISDFYRLYVTNLAMPEHEASFTPSLGDLFAFPVIADLLGANDSRDKVTSERWDAIVDSLPGLFEDHKRRLESTCLSLLSSARQKLNSTRGTQGHSQTPTKVVPNDDALLERASSIFQCAGKYRGLGCSTTDFAFTDIMRHEHVNACYRANAVNATQRYAPGDLEAVVCLEMDLEIADALLHSLGLPSSTTMAFMKSLGSRLVCKRCGSVGSERKMTWLGLVGHFRSILNTNKTVHYISNSYVYYDKATKDNHDLKHPSLLAITADKLPEPVSAGSTSQARF